MAMMVVKVVVENLGSLLAEEAQFLGVVGNGVAELRDDLESMRSFLQDAEARSESNKGIQTWVKQVRDVAYNTEDILEEFLLCLSPPQGDARHGLAVHVEAVKRKVKAISERRNAFSFKRMEEATSSAATTTLQTWNDPRLASLFLDDADVVRIENPKSLLISWLVSGEQNLTAISVVGMGGVGKTTLVKKVYDSQTAKKYFDRHAWITVSQSITVAQLLRVALNDFLEETKEPIPEGIDTMDERQLINKLRAYLQQKSYVIVFDDVWSINVWEVVKLALPDSCCGSRIIFTTRIGDIAASIEATGHVHHLQPLPDKEAWSLFCIKAFQGENKVVCPKSMKHRHLSEGSVPVSDTCRTRGGHVYYSDEWLHEDQNRVPPHRDEEVTHERNKCFKRYFEDITERTKVITELLVQPASSSCCERNWSTYSFIHSVRRNKMVPQRAEDLVFIHSNLRLLSRRSSQYLQGETKMWDIAGDNFDSLDDIGMLGIANLSLDEPAMEAILFTDEGEDGGGGEDVRIKIIRLWVVERFVEEKPGLTAEEVVEDYLNELVSRSMIQVVKKDNFNRVRTCCVHDIMREIIQLKSRDISFAMILLNDRRMSTDEKIRRMSIHANCKEELPSDIRFTSHRSLLVFVSTRSSMSLGKTFFKGFKLLGVLELELAPLYEFPPELTEMIHLRYLSLRSTMLRKLPESIGKLKKLEILDLKHCLMTCISSLPNGILKLKHLCQLRAYGYCFESSTMFASTYGMHLPGKKGELTNLQKLGNVEVNDNGDMLRELGKLTQLRRLGILKLTQENGMELCSSLEKLKHLIALYMVSISTTEPLHLNSLSSGPRFLQRLYLKYSLPTLPKWIASLQYLAKLVLQHSNLNDDPLKSLHGLPNFVVLELREAFVGEELCCNIGGYPRLKKLSLQQLSQLKRLRVEQGAMPGVRGLDIAACEKLEMVPLGIEHLRNLQRLMVWFMPWRFYQTIARPHGEDFWKVQHIQTIEAIY
ncbi:unnamed protein product [Camellia sinensis]